MKAVVALADPREAREPTKLVSEGRRIECHDTRCFGPTFAVRCARAPPCTTAAMWALVITASCGMIVWFCHSNASGRPGGMQSSAVKALGTVGDRWEVAWDHAAGDVDSCPVREARKGETDLFMHVTSDECLR